jgi:hypothetical protein
MNVLRVSRVLFVASGLTLSVAGAAYAANPSHEGGARVEDGDGDKKFPMAAADFRQHVSARIDQARARMEQHIASQQLPQDQADALRARFNAGVAQGSAKVDEVCADGTVTRDEARSVHELAKSLWHHRHDS